MTVYQMSVLRHQSITFWYCLSRTLLCDVAFWRRKNLLNALGRVSQSGERFNSAHDRYQAICDELIQERLMRIIAWSMR